MNTFTIVVSSGFILYVIVLFLQFFVFFCPPHSGVIIDEPNTLISYYTPITRFDVHVFFSTAMSLRAHEKSKPKARFLNVSTAELFNNGDERSLSREVIVRVPKKLGQQAYAHVLVGQENEKLGVLSNVAASVVVPMVAQRKVNGSDAPHMLNKLTVMIERDHYNLSSSVLSGDMSTMLRVTRRNKRMYYLPNVAALESAWASKFERVLLNDSVAQVHVNVTLKTTSLGFLRMSRQFEVAFSSLHEMMGDEELDNLKYAAMNTNPKMLALTLVVSLLHTLFDILAFRSDITFWQQRKHTGGISRRAMVLSFFCQVVIFLYLLDHRANTSNLVIGLSAVSIVVSAWKLTKAFRMNGAAADGRMSNFEEKTQQYDAEITTYIAYALVPLLLVGCIYSYLFVEVGDKSVYSWVLESFAGVSYLVGFLLMLPQLYINYKLKSVSHMNWTRLMYSALNTFIDDLFAFIIVMPDMHFWSVFRDDIVFIVFLAQRCMYRTRHRSNATTTDDNDTGAANEKIKND